MIWVTAVIWLLGAAFFALPGNPAGEALGGVGPAVFTQFISAYAAMLLASLGLAYLVNRRLSPSLTNGETSNAHSLIWRLFPVACVGILLASLGGSPWLDDDIYRYIWDGGLMSYGHSPYHYAPADLPRQTMIPPEVYESIGYKAVASIYPPIMTAWLRLLTFTVGPNAQLWLLLTAAVSCGVLGLLLNCSLKLNLPPAIIVAVLFNPVWVKEFGDSGHGDILGLLFILMCWSMANRAEPEERWAPGWAVLSGLTAACAAAVKPWFGVWLLFLPPANHRLRWLQWGAAGFWLCVLGFWGFQDSRDFASWQQNLAYFSEYWVFNPGVVDFLHWSLSLLADSAATTPYSAAATWGYRLSIGILVLAWLRTYRGSYSGLSTFWLWMAALCCWPVINHWYTITLIPGLLLLPWHRHPFASVYACSALLLLSLQTFSGYLYWVHLSDLTHLRWAGWIFFIGGCLHLIHNSLKSLKEESMAYPPSS